MKIIVDIPWSLEDGPRPKRQAKITWTCSYIYRDERGRAIFKHNRFKTDDERGKTFSYTKPMPAPLPGWEKGKPAGADNYLWRVPSILANPNDEWWWTEGEKDAKALYEAGVEATSHHGGAGHTTLAQARWLAQARRVVLVVDRDVNGAYCALRRYRLLRKVGLTPRQIRFVHAAVGKDAADHLAAGWHLEDFLRARLVIVKKLAAEYSPTTANSGGYIYIGRSSSGCE